MCRFEGFAADSIAAGVAIHQPAADEYVTGADYVAFNDPTTAPGGRGVGRIYVGVINAQPGVTSRYMDLPAPKGKATGHAVTVAPYREGSDYSYYWGSSWNKGRFMTFDSWVGALEDMSRRLRAPLKVMVER